MALRDVVVTCPSGSLCEEPVAVASVGWTQISPFYGAREGEFLSACLAKRASALNNLVCDVLCAEKFVSNMISDVVGPRPLGGL